MNHWNPWETALRSWTPRPPSSRVKERLFGRGRETASLRARDADTARTGVETRQTWPALAPALAVFMLFAFLAGQGPDLASPGGSLPAMQQLIGGGEREVTTFASLGSSMHSPHNNLQKATFEWTNESPSLTTSQPISGTNSLFH